MLYLPLLQIFMHMGIPHLLMSDNGSEFKNELDKKLIVLLGIKHIFTTPYHPLVKAVIALDVKYAVFIILACLLMHFTLMF